MSTVIKNYKFLWADDVWGQNERVHSLSALLFGTNKQVLNKKLKNMHNISCISATPTSNCLGQ